MAFGRTINLFSELLFSYLRMNIVIRKAIAEDCPEMLRLIRELAEYEKAPDAVTVTLDHFRDSGFGPQPVWWAFVAETDGKMVGMALWYIRYSTWKGQRMYLEDIVVSEAWRCRGIGGRLMDALIAEAKTLGLSGITWQVLEWNDPAIQFYKKYEAQFDSEWINAGIELQ